MNIISLWTLPLILILILTLGLIKKVPLYEVFTDGAKEGFKVAVNITALNFSVAFISPTLYKTAIANTTKNITAATVQ